LVELIQSDPELSKKYAKNRYISPFNTQKKLEQKMRGLEQKRQEEKLKKSEWKQKRLEKRLNKLQNPLQSKEMAQAIKKANIYKARKISEKQEWARQYVEDLAQNRQQGDTGHNANKAPTSNPIPIKPSDLVV
jgi:CCR4-NOT transcriptional regulation complex NOT5 subunit